MCAAAPAVSPVCSCYGVTCCQCVGTCYCTADAASTRQAIKQRVHHDTSLCTAVAAVLLSQGHLPVLYVRRCCSSPNVYVLLWISKNSQRHVEVDVSVPMHPQVTPKVPSSRLVRTSAQRSHTSTLQVYILPCDDSCARSRPRVSSRELRRNSVVAGRVPGGEGFSSREGGATQICRMQEQWLWGGAQAVLLEQDDRSTCTPPLTVAVRMAKLHAPHLTKKVAS